MLIEDFVKDEGRLNYLEQALSILKSINVFGLMLEVGARRAQPRPNTSPIEYAALRAAYHDGYTDALDDLFNFREKYAEQAKSKPRAGFGAAEKLWIDKEYTDEEYQQVTGKLPPRREDII